MLKNRVNMTRFQGICTTALLVGCLVVLAAPGRNLVVCVRADGHWGYEDSRNGRCVETQHVPAELPLRPPGVDRNDGGGGDCIGCVDFPILVGAAIGASYSSDGAKKKSPSQNTPGAPAIVPTRLARDLSGANSCSCASCPDTPPSSCATARVLRI